MTQGSPEKHAKLGVVLRVVRGSDRESLALGTKTPWGKIAAVQMQGGERYYMMTTRSRSVAYMPAEVVERAVEG